MDTAIRRRKKTGKRAGRRSAVLSKGERRRLIQLAVSLAVFALAFVGRSVFPEQLGQWNAALRQDTDFKSAFSQFGQAVSRGEPVLDTLGELWVEVFAGGAPREANPIYAQMPSLTQRCRTQILEQDDPIGAWCRTYLTRETQAGGTDAAAPAEQTGRETGTGGTADLPSPAAGEGPTVDLRAALISAPETQTAVAQAEDETGQALPASVSLQQYTLGLSGTITPLYGTLTSDYGYRDHPVSGDHLFHRGVDIGGTLGNPIAAFADGVVDCVGESGESGLYVQLDHGNGVKTFYAHCSELYVSKGDPVKAGQTVAAVGETGNATGPHLHFAVIKDGIYLDPLYYIQVG